MARITAAGQGLLYLLTGLWPVIDRRSFEAVTGPKQDFWLVKTLGAVLALVGGVLFSAALRRRVTPEMAALGVGTAAILAAADLLYSGSGRIPKIYQLDAAGEGLVLAAWGISLSAGEGSSIQINFPS